MARLVTSESYLAMIIWWITLSTMLAAGLP
jgi:hypothetical protein